MKLNSLFLTPLGAAAPIGVNKKEIIPAIIAAGAALGAAGLGALSQNSANKANLQGVQDTNEANRQINESQLAWARQQYSMERLENRFLVDQAYQRELENRAHNEAYNSPAQQVARLRAAGINPALAMYGGAGSVGASQGSVNAQVGQNPHANLPSMIPMQSGVIQPIDFNSLAVAGQNMSDFILRAERQETDINVLKEHQRNETIKTLQEIENLKVEQKYKDALTSEVIRASQFEDYHMKGRSDQIALSNYMTKIQCKQVLFSMIAKDVELQISQALAASNIRLNNSQIGLVAVNIANGMIDGRIKSADAALKEFQNGIITDPNNPQNRTREMWNETAMKHLRFLTQAFGDLLNDVIPLRDLLKLGK